MGVGWLCREVRTPIALLLSAKWIQWAEGTGVHKLQKEKDSLRNSLCVNRQTCT